MPFRFNLLLLVVREFAFEDLHFLVQSVELALIDADEVLL